jgi:hypothetical protein
MKTASTAATDSAITSLAGLRLTLLMIPRDARVER